MKERVNELRELSKGIDTQMVEIKNGLAKVNSMLSMIEQGSNNTSVEAIPMVVCLIKQNLKDLVGSKVHKMEEYSVRTHIILGSLDSGDEKPKRTRKPRTPKPVGDEVKTPVTRARERTKKVEPVDKPVEPEVKPEDTKE